MSMNTQRKRKRSMKRIQTKELLLGDRNDTQKKILMKTFWYNGNNEIRRKLSIQSAQRKLAILSDQQHQLHVYIIGKH